MSLADIRTALAAAVEAALADDDWLVTDKIPLTPDDPAVWVRFGPAGWGTIAGGIDYQIIVTFACGLNDTDLAQEALNSLYDTALWLAIEAYDTDAWQGMHVLGFPDEPYQLPLADSRLMLAVDMPVDIHT